MGKGSQTVTLNDLPPTTCSSCTTEENETGDWRYQKPLLDSEKCNRCGVCWMFCPDNAVRPEKDSYIILYAYCKGCGICAEECPKGAISLVTEDQ